MTCACSHASACRAWCSTTSSDIAKAIALGADAVQLGRATLYGLAAGGERGVLHAIEILKADFERAMALTGATSVAELRGRVDAPSCRPEGAQV